MTGWRTGLRMRDYDVAFAQERENRNTQATREADGPCPERVLVLPISSKGTREVGVFDKASNTNRIIEVTDDGKCIDVLGPWIRVGQVVVQLRRQRDRLRDVTHRRRRRGIHD